MLLLVACNRDDDTKAIFSGKFKISSYRYNNGYDNESIKKLNHSKEVYWLEFDQSSFHGVLAEGTTISGSWTADGGSRVFLTGNISVTGGLDQFGEMIRGIITGATRYSGDEYVANIIKEDGTYITLDKKFSTI